MPTLVRARLYASRQVVFVFVNKEGGVGSVSGYTEISNSDDGKDAGFSVAARKRPPRLLSFGMGVDSIKIFPCFERRTRIYCGMSLRRRSANRIPPSTL